MKQRTHDNLEAAWARLGVLFNVRPTRRAVDPERLLIETAWACDTNPRLLPLAVSWLVVHGVLIARHRLKRLIREEGDPKARAVLGLIIEAALQAGAFPELKALLEECVPLAPPLPLFSDYAADPGLRDLAERNGSGLSRRWGVWAPEVQVKLDAIRPGPWVIDHNEGFRDRAIRKGDLRCSILRVLELDTDGVAPSESELGRLCAAQRTAVRKALDALMHEGAVEPVADVKGHRNAIAIRRSA